MTNDEKDKLVSQIISTDAGRKWLVGKVEDAGTPNKLGETVALIINGAHQKATKDNRKQQETENCSHCRNRGWWQNEFLDELYCECPLGQKLKEEESDGIRREDK